MKNTNQTRESSNRRRDIGSGQYWELLNRDLLNLLFNNVEIKERVLFNSKTSYLIIWDEKFGLAVTNTSDRLSALVISQDGAASIRNFIDRHGGFSVISNHLMTSKVREAVIDSIAEQFASHIKLGSIKDYTSLDVAKFKLEHFTTEANKNLEEGERPETSPRRRLVSEHTTDTGRSSSVMLKSIKQPITKRQSAMPGAHPGTDTRSNVLKKILIKSRHFPKLALALSMFEEEGIGPRQEEDTGPRQEEGIGPRQSDIIPDITAGSEKANMTEELLHIDQDGTAKILPPGPDKKEAFLSAGGPSDTLVVNSSRNSWGTRRNSYKQEGTIDSPLAVNPSAHFYPAPNVITDMKTAWTTLVDNPAIIMGLLAIAINPLDKKTHYTTVYKNLPLVITDLENKDGEL
jgi:hypothetical protein